MLQTPSKYHPNPLSQFLALHNSVASHQTHQQIQNQNQQFSGSSLGGNIATNLDVGKSFTIAAILGLQKNAVENGQQEYHNVMNLSLNNQKSINLNNDDNSERNVNNIGCNNTNSNIISKYYSGNGIRSVNQNQVRHHFTHDTTAVATAATAINVGVPSALQSLQQLHQHHAQQANLGFHIRDKTKPDNISNKKSCLKSKRVRTIFTPDQLERLEAEFERQQYMVGPERLYLAHTLQLTEAQVKVWFQNRRIKWRKHHLEVTQQRLALMRQTQMPCNESNTNNQPMINQLNHSELELSMCNESVDEESFTESDEI